MSRQSIIDKYFKSKASTCHSTQKLDNVIDMDIKEPTKVNKRRSLSLKPRTPTKVSKVVTDENKVTCEVINLCSDEEDILESPPKEKTQGSLSQGSTDSAELSSDCTVIYSPKSLQSTATPRKDHVLSSPKTSPCDWTAKTELLDKREIDKESISNEILPLSQVSIKSETLSQVSIKSETFTQSFTNAKTPQRAPVTPSTSQNSPSQSTKTPREKFFSPVKKRSVTKKTPSKVKRNLSSEMSRGMSSRILFEDDLYAAACEGMDDKTKFLLHIINEFLNKPSLKNLLDLDSQTLLTNCLQVVKPGMKLVCRLFWRKEGWRKKEEVIKICSEDSNAISDPNFEEMMNSLIEKGLIDQASLDDMTFDDYADILKKDELKQICKEELKVQTKVISSKQHAIEALRTFSKRSSNISHFLTGPTSSNSRRVLLFMAKKVGPCYKLSELARKTLHNLYLLMYLGMDYSIIRERRLELVLLYDKIQRETYPIDKDMQLDDASVVFRTKDEFDRFVTAHSIHEDFLLRTNVAEKCCIVKQLYDLYKNIGANVMSCYTSLPRWLYRYTPPNIYIKILEAGIQELKKEKITENYYLASEILSDLIKQMHFRQHKKAEWYAEKALILHTYLNQYDEAAKVLVEGFESNISEEAKDCMRSRARKIARQKNTPLSDHLRATLAQLADKDTTLEKSLDSKHVHKLPMDRVGSRGKVKFESRTPQGRIMQDAEEFCIAEYLYTKEFTHGEHWEGRIVTTLFFLLFWDIIYSKPEGARGIFLSYYQQHPLDLYTDSFYTNRKEAIDNWLLAIEYSGIDKLIEMMHDTWKKRPEHELSGLSRGGISWEQVADVSRCLGPRRLAALCRRLATNYAYAHSGFPDLTLWHTHTRRIKFVEVKTDSDKPSMKQIQWMQYLKSNEIETEFCYVGVHTTRQRSRNLVKPITVEVKTEE